MHFSTSKHEEYIDYMKGVCNKNRFSLVLKGSLAHGTAKPFSDIDLLLYGKVDSNLLDEIISGYDTIVMTNFTEKPSGIYILNYKNGISVDLDIRECVLSSEVENSVILCDYGFKIADIIERSVITSSLMPERPEWYKTIRLIHRCCIKFLCGKVEIAQGLADEVCSAVYALTNQKTVKSDSIKQRMMDSLQYINQNYFIDQSILDLLEELFQEMDDVL